MNLPAQATCNYDWDIFRAHLKHLASGEPFSFKRADAFAAELRKLLSLGLLVRRPGRGVRSLFEAGDDVRNHLEITDRGRAYVAYLHQVERAGQG